MHFLKNVLFVDDSVDNEDCEPQDQCVCTQSDNDNSTGIVPLSVSLT